MKNLKIALFGMLLLSALGWWGCNKDKLSPGAKIVDAAFAGRIIDEAGLPVSGAQVKVGDKTINTNDQGVFRTEQVSLADNDAIISVKKNGYFDFSRAYFVEDEALQTVTIQLIRKIQVGSFVNASGGTITIPGGPTLQFPANAMDASGSIRVFARYLNPTDAELGLFMPGDLRAINAGGDEQTLATYGMVAVELEGTLGKAQIAAGKEVELSMPIQASQAAEAPAEIALWYFDTEKARWIEDGKAQKVGSQYVGNVKHFTFWNCDIGLPLVQLSGKVYIGDEQHPLANAEIKLIRTGSNWPGYGTTNENGCFSGAVIKDEVFELSIIHHDQCGQQVLYTATVGPFSENTVLPPIILSGVGIFGYTISGTLVDCDGDPVANGYVSITPDAIAFTDANGAFSYNLLSCVGLSSLSAQGFDLDNLKESPIQSASLPAGGGAVDFGTLTACTGLDEYIQFTLDGQAFTALDPSSDLIDSTGTGTDLLVYLSSFNGTSTSATLSFAGNQAGTYPLISMGINNLYAAQPITATTTVTNFPTTAGGYYIGTFGTAFKDTQGVNHTISGNYRVKRDN